MASPELLGIRRSQAIVATVYLALKKFVGGTNLLGFEIGIGIVF